MKTCTLSEPAPITNANDTPRGAFRLRQTHCVFFPFFLSLSCVSSFLGRRSKKCLPERGIGPGPVDALFSVIEPRRNPRKRNSWDRFWELTSLFFLHKFWKDLHSSPYDWSRTKEKIMCVFFCCLSERRVITTLAEHGELIADSLNSDGDTGKDPRGIKLLAAACRRRNWSWRFFHRNSLSAPAKFSLD